MVPLISIVAIRPDSVLETMGYTVHAWIADAPVNN